MLSKTSRPATAAPEVSAAQASTEEISMAVEQRNQFLLPARRLTWPAIAATLVLSACSTIQPAGEPAAPDQPIQPSLPAAPVVTPKMQAARDNLKVIAGLQERLYRIAAPLLINNADLCKAQARNL